MKYDINKPNIKHCGAGMKTFDNGLSFEGTCKCGFHTADDLLMMRHIDKYKETRDDTKRD